PAVRGAEPVRAAALLHAACVGMEGKPQRLVRELALDDFVRRVLRSYAVTARGSVLEVIYGSHTATPDGAVTPVDHRRDARRGGDRGGDRDGACLVRRASAGGWTDVRQSERCRRNCRPGAA